MLNILIPFETFIPILSFSLFLIGVLGIFITRRNIIIIIMSIELILVSVNLLFIFLSIYLDDIYGQIFALYILTIGLLNRRLG